MYSTPLFEEIFQPSRVFMRWKNSTKLIPCQSSMITFALATPFWMSSMSILPVECVSPRSLTIR